MWTSTVCLITRERLGNALKRRSERRLSAVYLLKGLRMTKQDSTIEYNNGRAGFFICNRFYRTAIILKGPIQTNIKRISEISSKKNSILIEVLNNLETLKSLGTSSNIQWEWEENSGKIAKNGLYSRMLAAFIPFFSSLLIQLNTVGIIVVGVYLIQNFESSYNYLYIFFLTFKPHFL